MAQRRMFSPDIVCSEEFLDLPATSRELYFQLGMRADDDGFIQPKMIMRTLGASQDDLKVLIAKRFLLPFETGVVVVKHWLIHNMIRQDRYKETRFLEEKKALFIKENKAYTDNPDNGDRLMATKWQPNGNLSAPQVRLGKDSINYSAKAQEVEVTMQPVDDDGNELVKRKGIKRLVTARKDEFNHDNAIKELYRSAIKVKRIVALYFDRRKWRFENWDQFETAVARESKPAVSLKGYDGQRILRTMEYCEKEWEDNWTLETVASKIQLVP